MSTRALRFILAAANGTSAAQLDSSKDLSFNYVPTGWAGIVFLVLFGVTTAVQLLEGIFFKAWFMIKSQGKIEPQQD